ncbi:hypothetical protein HMPREF1544_05835 [Mucor circinelloides 1006PhL]|uniref:Cytochrome b561 domain-containing protein n=1 Tax=Mucor circinelloides f. circinelloides (strain 1006PhL) TaxID=1220926 RepID=S2JCB3_MUCC1|nr:hypothetical protein HMPREF1544_05835 [Mucor circinelloides 1006PhL]
MDTTPKLSFLAILLVALCIQPIFAEQKAMNHAEMDMLQETVPKFNESGTEPMSYALFPDDKGLFYSHVAFMTIGFWCLMPMGIMLGVAKSSLHVPIQILTVIFAMFGFFFGKLYGHSAPHLYQGNVHHSLGWALFALLITQVVGGFVRKISNAIKNHVAESDRYETIGLVNQQGSSSSPAGSERSNSIMSESTLHNNRDDMSFEDESMTDVETEDPLAYSFNEKTSLFKRMTIAILPFIPNVVKRGFEIAADNRFTNTFCRILHQSLGRVFVLLVFTQTISGMVVYHGVCRDWEIFGCIAHLIKGGIFFWYGIVTFARYLGSFADKGWAWNYVPNGSKFSFEMIECSLIFFYGITNTWMEHFGQDDAWTHKDLEHASLAFMFWWAGLLGILIESRSVRRILEKSMPRTPYDDEEFTVINRKQRSTKRSRKQETIVNFNPIPALTILMTGLSLGNHHQDTLYSSRVHYLWGMLISAAAICRIITYITLFKNPPRSGKPLRPPSEALGAFLLVCGSILFMGSNAGTILWLRRNAVDSMFLLNVTVSLTAMVLSHVAFLVVLKAWAANREVKKQSKKLEFLNRHRNSLKQRNQFEIGQDEDEAEEEH